MNKLNEIEIKKMIGVAVEARQNAFAFKSGHKIGACVLSVDGEYYGGCNTEGVISSLGVCAEMSAMDHAVIHGKYQFKALTVADEHDLTFPCGACLQYLTQFSQTNNQDIHVIVANEKGDYQISSLNKELPRAHRSRKFATEIQKFVNK